MWLNILGTISALSTCQIEVYVGLWSKTRNTDFSEPNLSNLSKKQQQGKC